MRFSEIVRKKGNKFQIFLQQQRRNLTYLTVSFRLNERYMYKLLRFKKNLTVALTHVDQSATNKVSQGEQGVTQPFQCKILITFREVDLASQIIVHLLFKSSYLVWRRLMLNWSQRKQGLFTCTCDRITIEKDTVEKHV